MHREGGAGKGLAPPIFLPGLPGTSTLHSLSQKKFNFKLHLCVASASATNRERRTGGKKGKESKQFSTALDIPCSAGTPLVVCMSPSMLAMRASCVCVFPNTFQQHVIARGNRAIDAMQIGKCYKLCIFFPLKSQFISIPLPSTHILCGY